MKKLFALFVLAFTLSALTSAATVYSGSLTLSPACKATISGCSASATCFASTVCLTNLTFTSGYGVGNFQAFNHSVFTMALRDSGAASKNPTAENHSDWEDRDQTPANGNETLVGSSTTLDTTETQHWLNDSLVASEGFNSSTGPCSATFISGYCEYYANVTVKVTCGTVPCSAYTNLTKMEYSVYLVDATPPKYFNQQENLTEVPEDDPVLLSVYWTDNFGLSTAILSTNETGTWVNHSGRYGSYLPISNTGNWSNFTWRNDSTPDDSFVSWRVWANDTSGNWNVSGIFNFTTRNKPNNKPTIYTPKNGTVYSSYQSLLFSMTGGWSSYKCGYALIPENNQSWAIISANFTVTNNTNNTLYLIGLGNAQHTINVTCWELGIEGEFNQSQSIWNYSVGGGSPPSFQNFTNTFTPSKNAQSVYNESTYCGCYASVAAVPFQNYTKSWTPSLSAQSDYQSNDFCGSYSSVSAVPYTNWTNTITPNGNAKSVSNTSTFCDSYFYVNACPTVNITNTFTPSTSIQTIYNDSNAYCKAWTQVEAVAFTNYTKSFTPSTVAQSNYQSNAFCGSYCDVSAVAVTNFTNIVTADGTTQTINNNTEFCGNAITVNPTPAPTPVPLINISLGTFAPSVNAQAAVNTTSTYCNAYAWADPVPVVNLTNTFTPSASIQSIQNNTAFASCNATVEAIAKVNISIANFVPSTVAQSASNTTIDYCNAYCGVDAVPVTNFTETISPSTNQQSIWNATEFCSNNATVDAVPFTNFTHSFTPDVVAQSDYQSNTFCGAYSAVSAISIVNISLGTFTPSLVAQSASNIVSPYCNAYAWVNAVPFTNFSNYFTPTTTNQSVYNETTFCGSYSWFGAVNATPICPAGGGSTSPNMLIIRTQTPIPMSNFPYPH